MSLKRNKKKDKENGRSGRSESCVLFSGEAFDFILPLLIMQYILCFAICRLYDEFRKTCKCVSIEVFFSFDIVNVVFGVAVTNHELPKMCHIDVSGCYCRPLGTCMWCVSCYCIYHCLCYVSHYP